MLYADIVLLLLVALVIIYSVIAGAPKPLRDPPTHVLICAAHSDDCVIVGAEYAYGAILQGFSVKIVYLTCSGPHPDAEISQIRTTEALTAWSTLGVLKENLIFANLIQSSVEGPTQYSVHDVARAKEIFKKAILSLPKNAAVIAPAQGEAHVDHRTVREVTLQAICETGRKDLIVYECPEYNAFLSLIHCPMRTIRTVIRYLPLLRWFIKPYAGSPNYVNGSSGFVFRDTPNRLTKKRELLTYFTSQDGDLLLRYFGYETPYRRLELSEHRYGECRVLCVSAFSGCCDVSALALGLSLLCAIFLTAHEVARALAIALMPAAYVGTCLALLGVVVAGTYIIRRIRGTVNLETTLFIWAGALGLISGVF